MQELTNEEIVALARDLTPEELVKKASHFSSYQLALLLHALDSFHSELCEKKMGALFVSLTHVELLELVGKEISLPQSITLLQEIAKDTEKQGWKLQPLLVGMGIDLFKRLLLSLPYKLLRVLNVASGTEPLYHQLNLFKHEEALKISAYETDYQELKRNIENVDLNSLSRSGAQLLKEKIEDQRRHLEEEEKKIDAGLALAWNGNCPDLVEDLSQLKTSVRNF